MQSPETISSPRYKHMEFERKLSPLEIKEKIRKALSFYINRNTNGSSYYSNYVLIMNNNDSETLIQPEDYKEKIRTCRNLLKNNFRRIVSENDLRNKINELYISLFNFNEENIFVDEEQEVLQQIKDEFLQEELNWFIEEHEKSMLHNVDWSILDSDNVICPICEKTNIEKYDDNITCSICQWTLQSTKNLEEIKTFILKSVEDHNRACSNNVQFTVTTDALDTHMYLICNSCMEMNVIL